MLITPQHQELLNKYNSLVLRSIQYEEVIRKKDEQIAHLASQITPLKNAFDQLKQMVEGLQQQNELLIKIIAEKDKELDRLSMIEFGYEQMKKLVYGRSSEKSHALLPGQLLLPLDAQVVEACNINDGQKVAGYTKSKAKNENHPGRNKIPPHIKREYVDIYPDNLPAGAQQYDKEETEQLEYDPAKFLLPFIVVTNTSCRILMDQ